MPNVYFFSRRKAGGLSTHQISCLKHGASSLYKNCRICYNVSATGQHLKVEVSGQAADEGEEAKDGDEKKLESVGVKAKDEVIGLDVVTDGGDVLLGLGGASQEHGDGSTLLALKIGEAILVDVLAGDAAEGLVLAGLGGLSEEGGVVGLLLTDGGGVDEDGGGGLVAATGDVSEADLLSGFAEGGVSLGFRGGSLLLSGRTVKDGKRRESEGEGILNLERRHILFDFFLQLVSIQHIFSLNKGIVLDRSLTAPLEHCYGTIASTPS